MHGHLAGGLCTGCTVPCLRSLRGPGPAAAPAAWGRRPAQLLGAAPCGALALRQAGRRVSRLRCEAGARRARTGRRRSPGMQTRRRRGPDWRRNRGPEWRMEDHRLAALAALAGCSAYALAGCALRRARRHLIGQGRPCAAAGAGDALRAGPARGHNPAVGRGGTLRRERRRADAPCRLSTPPASGAGAPRREWTLAPRPAVGIGRRIGDHTD